MQMCNILSHLCDRQLRHRLESLVAFAQGYVQKVQVDQKNRLTQFYNLSIKINGSRKAVKMNR